MGTIMLTEADRQAVDALTAVDPAWTGMRTAADALGLETHTLLHCGPPAAPAHALVPPILNSAAVACVFEGWADDLDEASTLVSSGFIRFLPAQDHRAATPMAAVISPSMRLIEMSDLKDSARRCYAPINGGGHGGSPVARYGRRTPQCVAFLRFLNDPVADLLDQVCSEPISWLPLIDHALTSGDDTHLHHIAAHACLLQMIDTRRRGLRTDAESDVFIREWPIFHLNFWMAAVRCIFEGATGVSTSSLVTAFGGNGKAFGLQVSGLPERWFITEATPPIGRLRDGFVTADTTGALGDSAIIEALGLGALAQRYAPQIRELFAGHHHDDLLSLPAKLLVTAHPKLPESGALTGLIARNVVAQHTTPVIELGIVDRTGKAGGLGAGLYRPPLDPFAAACRALALP